MQTKINAPPRPLVQTARDAQQAMLITSAQLARMTDGTVSNLDKEVARRAYDVALRGVQAAAVSQREGPQAEKRLALAIELGTSIDVQLKSQGLVRTFIENRKDANLDLNFGAEWDHERTLRAAQEAAVQGFLPPDLALRLVNGAFGKQEALAVHQLVGPADAAAHQASVDDKPKAIEKAETLGRLAATLYSHYIKYGDGER